MPIVVGFCLLGVLCGLGYASLGSEAATAHALEEGLLIQKRDHQLKCGKAAGSEELRKREQPRDRPFNNL